MADRFNLEVHHDSGQAQTAVVLPCGPDQFSRFIAGLLGKPQELEGVFHGRFRIDLEGATQLHHLITQRVMEQHGVAPLQFTAKLIFGNGTSVQLNTFVDFTNYHEVRAITSTGLILTWTFLVHFQGAAAPEKQEIEVSFGVGRQPDFGSGRDSGAVGYHVRHTARTWGADIESLLTHYIHGVIRSEHRARVLLRAHSGAFAFALGATMFIALVAGMLYSTAAMDDRRIAALVAAQGSQAQVAVKIDAIAAYLVGDAGVAGMLLALVYVLFSAVASIATGGFIATRAERMPAGDVVFTKLAEERYEVHEREFRRSSLSILQTIAISIVLAVAGNFVYDFAIKRAVERQLASISSPKK